MLHKFPKILVFVVSTATEIALTDFYRFWQFICICYLSRTHSTKPQALLAPPVVSTILFIVSPYGESMSGYE